LLQKETLIQDKELIIKALGVNANMSHSHDDKVPDPSEKNPVEDINEIEDLNRHLFKVLQDSPSIEKDVTSRNVNMGDNSTEITRAYMGSLTRDEIRLLYASFTIDFTLYGYSPYNLV